MKRAYISHDDSGRNWEPILGYLLVCQHKDCQREFRGPKNSIYCSDPCRFHIHNGNTRVTKRRIEPGMKAMLSNDEILRELSSEYGVGNKVPNLRLNQEGFDFGAPSYPLRGHNDYVWRKYGEYCIIRADSKQSVIDKVKNQIVK